MDKGKQEKIEVQIAQIAAQFIERESNKTALISVTRVEVTERGRNATIFISVLPESGEDSAINFLKRKRNDLRTVIKKGVNMINIPFVDVQIDKGEKARQNIDALLYEGEK
ncbi:MAG: ribosome-binding factor A [Candidatus Pacebacteria bacterium]|nr:ribosome-binding factor A [Candidatus Paceibacterota bacterium]